MNVLYNDHQRFARSRLRVCSLAYGPLKSPRAAVWQARKWKKKISTRWIRAIFSLSYTGVQERRVIDVYCKEWNNTKYISYTRHVWTANGESICGNQLVVVVWSIAFSLYQWLPACTHYIINIVVYVYSNDSNDGLFSVTFFLLKSFRKGKDLAGTVF